MRHANSFFISLGVHLSLAALMVGALSAVHKSAPVIEEKIALNLLAAEPTTSESPIPVLRPEPAVPPKVLQPTVKPQTPQIVSQPKQTVTEQIKPLMNPQMQTAPAASALAVPSAKVPEQPTQPPAAKAAPSTPKPQEHYEDENLGRIRTILMEKLVYPKNAQRLKQQGEAVVTFTLEPNREVSQITITKSSGFDLLDDAAKTLIETSASEFPKPQKSVRISLPIAYKLR